MVFLDLHKSYYTLDSDELLRQWMGDGACLKIQEVLAELWDNQEIFTRQNGYHVPQFRAICSKT